MTSDPQAIAEALDAASEAFEERGTPEEGMRDLADAEAQLGKACRLIEAAGTLQEQNGYHTAVVELSFGAIERSFEFYAIAVGGDEIHDFDNHLLPYERGAHFGVISQPMKEEFIGLYVDNRASSYYEGRAVTEEEADAMLELANVTHTFLRDHPRDHYDCLCE